MALFKEEQARGTHSLNGTRGKKGKEQGWSAVCLVDRKNPGQVPQALSYFQDTCQLDFTKQAQVPSLKVSWAPEHLGVGSQRWNYRCQFRSGRNTVEEGRGGVWTKSQQTVHSKSNLTQ